MRRKYEASPEIWSECEKFVCQTGDFEAAVREYERKIPLINVRYLKARAREEGWPVPKKLSKAIIAKQKTKANERLMEKVATNWAEKGEELDVMVFEKAVGQIQKTPAPVIKDWSDLKIATELARKAAKMDIKEEQKVSLTHHFTFLTSKLPDMGNVIEAEIIPQ